MLGRLIYAIDTDDFHVKRAFVTAFIVLLVNTGGIIFINQFLIY